MEELESEHGYAQRLGDVYEKVESERNQLLDELDMAFQDLQLYMQKQVCVINHALGTNGSGQNVFRSYCVGSETVCPRRID